MRIDIFYVILGLFLGFFFIYTVSPAPKVVIKYPNLRNAMNTTYVDEGGRRYQYQPEIIKY
jgi:hypothetical protein